MESGQVEILSPAGSLAILKGAFAAGADAVYAGGSCFGARAFAQNFTEDEMLEGIDYAHLHGRKLYLTVNTLVKEKEFGQLYRYLLPFYRQGLDAVIVQDMGVMEFVRREFPGLAIHASTQMTVTGARSAGFLEQQGVTRVVPARELSLAEIRRIRQETDLEMVDRFTPEELETIGRLEHQRWLQEHYDMGWAYGTPEREQRELVRLHPDMIPGFDVSQPDVTWEQAQENYLRLDQGERDKDTAPMECMLAMLRMFDGLRIYRLRS